MNGERLSLLGNEVVVVAGEFQHPGQFVHLCFDFEYLAFFDKVPLEELPSRDFEPRGQFRMNTRHWVEIISGPLVQK